MHEEGLEEGNIADEKGGVNRRLIKGMGGVPEVGRFLIRGQDEGGLLVRPVDMAALKGLISYKALKGPIRPLRTLSLIQPT